MSSAHAAAALASPVAGPQPLSSAEGEQGGEEEGEEDDRLSDRGGLGAQEALSLARPQRQEWREYSVSRRRPHRPGGLCVLKKNRRCAAVLCQIRALRAPGPCEKRATSVN